jgi:hypothetical protein
MINAIIIPLERYSLKLDFSAVVALGEVKTVKFIDFVESLVFETLELYSDTFWDGLTIDEEVPVITVDNAAMTEEQLDTILTKIKDWSDQQNNLK